MRTRSFFAAAFLMLLGLSTQFSVAAAAVPSPANSTIPGCLLTSPSGSIVSTIIVRDLANNTIVNSTVVIDYSQCPVFAVCPPSPAGDGYIVDLPNHQIRMLTGSGGLAPFRLRAGGGCSSAGIRIFADGVLLGQIRAAGLDQNGDLAVDGADVALVHSKIGTSDLSGDVNCDGHVDAADESLVAASVGVNCTQPTGTRPSSWGRMKTIYR